MACIVGVPMWLASHRWGWPASSATRAWPVAGPGRPPMWPGQVGGSATVAGRSRWVEGGLAGGGERKTAARGTPVAGGGRSPGGATSRLLSLFSGKSGKRFAVPPTPRGGFGEIGPGRRYTRLGHGNPMLSKRLGRLPASLPGLPALARTVATSDTQTLGIHHPGPRLPYGAVSWWQLTGRCRARVRSTGVAGGERKTARLGTPTAGGPPIIAMALAANPRGCQLPCPFQECRCMTMPP